MINSSTILQRVAQRVKDNPDGLSFVFIQRHDEPEEQLTWSRLWQLANGIAESIELKNNADKTGILIFCANERNFVLSLLAVWMRGAVAIPAIATLQKGVVARNQHIIEQSKPDIVLHDLAMEATMSIRELAPQASLLSIAEIDHSSDTSKPPIDLKNLCDSTGHLLQFTSGSTATPKPIYLDGSKVAANCMAIEQAYSLSHETVAVHWLPLFHDMGLIGSCISAMWTGCLSVLLRPSVFIQRPSVWLQQISHWKATITSAPNFAYERLCQVLKPGDLENLNLKSLENLIIGGEPVAKATMKKLLDTLSDSGLSDAALAPSYGMAEATLLISTGKRTKGPIYSTTHSTTPIIGLGSAVRGVELSIRDTKTGNIVSDNSLGEIWIRGKSIGKIVPAEQNWRHHKEIKQQAVNQQDIAINTGDYGYCENGNLFITGRDTNKLIIRGRNIFAEDVEQITIQSQPQNFCAAVAALGIDENGSQSLAILIEKNKINEEFNIGSLNKAIISKLGIKPHTIVLLKRASLPRTSSGKIQRNNARTAFIKGQYQHRVLHDVIQTGH